MNILFLDTETTGLSSEENSVIQIAAEYYVNGALTKSFNQKAYSSAADHPNRINLGALKVNKTKMADFQDINNMFSYESSLASDFADFLLSLDSKEQVVVCGENVNFDLGFIKQLFKRNRIDGLEALISYRVLDTATISLFLKDAGLLKVEKLGLGSVAKSLGVMQESDSSKQHEAGYDTKLTAQVYFKLLELVKDLNVLANSR